MAEKSFFENLWERRFIQFSLSYLVGAWGLIQFIDWIVKRYSYAPIWTDIALLFFLTLLPSVLLFTYFHGQKGPDQWRPIEKIIIPTNFIITIGLIFFFFSGKELGATATKVTVTNEEGQVEERLVPKSAFIRRVTILPWENKTGETEEDWLKLALPTMLDSDLEQDNRIIGVAPDDLNSEYDHYGYSIDAPIPLSIQRKMAQDNYTDFFLTGQLMKEGEDYIAKVGLYTTSDGKAFYNKEYRNSDPLNLVDDITDGFRSEVYVKDNQDKRFVDLPTSNLYSNSTEALKLYHEAVRKMGFENETAEGAALLQKATEIDPSFAMAYSKLCDALFLINQTDASKQAIEKAMKYKDALSERQQLKIKYTYQSFSSIEKAMALARMWQQLYPSDYKPYNYLIFLHQRRGEVDKAKKVGEMALENGHTGKILLTLAKLETLQGNTEGAIKYYERFAQEFPGKSKEVSGIGDIYLSTGEFDKALVHFEKMRLMNPDDINIQLKQASVAGKLEGSEQEWQLLNEALKDASTKRDSISVLSAQERLLHNTGRPNASLETMQQRWQLSETLAPEQQVRAEFFSSFIIKRYVDANRSEELKLLIEDYLAKYENPFINYRCIAFFNFYAFADNIEKLEELMIDCQEPLLKVLGDNGMIQINFYYSHVKDDYPKALEELKIIRDSLGVDPSLMATFGELYRETGQLDKAASFLEDFLKKNPNNAQQWYELALTYEAKGNIQKTKEALQRSANIWKHAEPDFIPVKKVREKLGSL